RLSVATRLRLEAAELSSEEQRLPAGVSPVLEALAVGVDHFPHVAQVGFVLEPCGFHPLGLVAVLVSEDPRERVLAGAGVLGHFSPAEYSPMAVSVSGSALPAWIWRWNSLNSSRSSPRLLAALPRAWASAIEYGSSSSAFSSSSSSTQSGMAAWVSLPGAGASGSGWGSAALAA